VTTSSRISTYTSEGLTFEVLDEGPPDGPVVVLLHGFPQDATAYGGVAALLAEAGVRTLAPHQRGYSPGARPGRVSAYGMNHLVEDVLALLDAAGVDRAHVVGHDWGAAVAWSVAQRHPERVLSLVALSVPHPGALAWAMRNDPDQLRRSWYMLAFQAPWTPELMMAQMMRAGTLRRMGVPAEHERRYAARLGRAVDARGPLNWYRAAMRAQLPVVSGFGVDELRGGGWHVLEGPGEGRGGAAMSADPVRVPTTFVWGRRDPYLGRRAAEGTERFVEGDYRFVEVDAGHWLPEKQTQVVTDEILARVQGVGG
jgi:pimeloyl-ACP methyl ester carboxylesterase